MTRACVHMNICHSNGDNQAHFYLLFIQGLRFRMEVWGEERREMVYFWMNHMGSSSSFVLTLPDPWSLYYQCILIVWSHCPMQTLSPSPCLSVSSASSICLLWKFQYSILVMRPNHKGGKIESVFFHFTSRLSDATIPLLPAESLTTPVLPWCISPCSHLFSLGFIKIFKFCGLCPQFLFRFIQLIW